jgi:hypothetical protein
MANVGLHHQLTLVRLVGEMGDGGALVFPMEIMNFIILTLDIAQITILFNILITTISAQVLLN